MKTLNYDYLCKWGYQIASLIKNSGDFEIQAMICFLTAINVEEAEIQNQISETHGTKPYKRWNGTK